ncbi:hypothetical protein [Aliarcobacter butzleri]|uniref:hypothetical protein n=1 Tax=Aliarcobacter butzleri TaxID=28197 RepID=UPI0021B35DB9|nr:hypothetical protein [Aliarcobacter butzleri]MCT7555347.1 hypothetical protein [Aliarcobacter butzleri]
MNYSNTKIQGNYWDVFSYMNYLVLVTDENEFIICDWYSLNKFIVNRNLNEIDKLLLERFIVKRINLSFKSSITDFCISNKKIYITNDEGFFSSNELTDLNEIKFSKLWDNRSFSLNNNGKGNISLSCGNDGLVEYSPNKYDLKLKKFESNSYSISENHSTLSNYNNFDLYNISAIGESELFSFDLGVNFKKEKLHNYKLKEIIMNVYNESEERLYFNNYDTNIISWMHKNKIYRIVGDNEIKVYSYDKNNHNIQFKKEETLYFQAQKGKILRGHSTSFGNVIECENALVVNFSIDDYLNIYSEPIQWRVYPNSKAYLNHLHVIFDDYLEIFKFF